MSQVCARFCMAIVAYALATRQALSRPSCSDAAEETMWLQIALYGAGETIEKHGLRNIMKK